MTTLDLETQNETEIRHGWIWDVETGECLGPAELKPQFHVTDMSSAEFVLGLMLEADSEMAGLRIRLAAIQEQIESMMAEKRRRREWLERRFTAELEAFARQELAGKKTRSLKTPFGTLSFRQTPGSTKVLDKALAIAWAKAHAPEAVVVREDLNVTPLKDREDLPSKAFEVTAPEDRFHVKTGVGG